MEGAHPWCGAVWENLGRLRTSCAAVFCIICKGRIVPSGRSANSKKIKKGQAAMWPVWIGMAEIFLC